jgi:hypothetical protein
VFIVGQVVGVSSAGHSWASPLVTRIAGIVPRAAAIELLVLRGDAIRQSF